MSDALTRMAAFLIQSPGWKPDRFVGVGPPARPVILKPEPPAVKRKIGLASRILTMLQKGPATGEEIAITLRANWHHVHANLSRMHRNGRLEREKSGISGRTGQKVQVYRLRVRA